MAHAARLNLRMQKELKLLLTDPPPGASFPHLSPNSDPPSSLSTLHAQIEGPEGTVYANGFFQIKIQIPERYPFQPPIVIFATPIYHPNIDTGGRICLDILNLPPKGAWQPSLNISTVLTSIGLLLSEPNPDDGLMCEASREYKYNRQAFDQKARSMTEKYAKLVTGGNNTSSQSLLILSNSITTERNGPNRGSEHEVKDEKICHKEQCVIGRKTSLESSGSSRNMEDNKSVNEVSNLVSAKHMQIQGPPPGSKDSISMHTLPRDKLSGTRRKLSLESLDQSQKRSDGYKEKASQDIRPLVLNNNNDSKACLDSPVQFDIQYKLQSRQDRDGKLSSVSCLSSKRLCQADQKQPLESLSTCQNFDGNCTKMHATPETSPPFHTNSSVPVPQVVENGLQPLAETCSRLGNGSTSLNHKWLSAVGRKLSLGYKGSDLKESTNKENIVPIQKIPQKLLTDSSVSSLTSQSAELYDGRMVNNTQKKNGYGRKLSLQPLRQLKESDDNKSSLLVSLNNECDTDGKQKSNQDQDGYFSSEIKQQVTEESSLTEELIVLDSEDSEEERNEPLRSKLSLARKRLGKKCRAKA